MKHLGILVRDLSPSELAYRLIRNTNSLLKARPDLDVVVFYEKLEKPCLPVHFATMQLLEAWGFPGPLMATNLSTAERFLAFPGATQKLFYSWNLDWLGPGRGVPEYRQFQSVYGHPELRLAARSADHVDALSKAWNKPVDLLEDFDLEQAFSLLG